MAATIPVTSNAVTANPPMNGTGIVPGGNANVVPTLPMSGSPAAGGGTSFLGNPYAVGSAPSTVPTSNGISTKDGDYTVMGDFKQTYGAGTGSAIVNTLANLGTSTDSAIAATTADAFQNANKSAAGIDSRLAAAGISKDSSTYALSQGDFWSGFNSNLNSTIANMQLNEQGTLLSTLLGEGAAHGGDSSWTDSIGDIFSGLTSAAGAISSGFGVGGTTGKILDTIGDFAI